jgi:hypothetical protein
MFVVVVHRTLMSTDGAGFLWSVHVFLMIEEIFVVRELLLTDFALKLVKVCAVNDSDVLAEIRC